MSIIENLLDDAGVDSGKIAGEDTLNRANQTVSRDHEINLGDVPGVDPGPEPVDLLVNSDPEEESEDQFDDLSDEAFGTNAVEICIEKEGVDGETDIGVQVTDHHGTFNKTPTTWNPGSSFLAPATIEFEAGTGCFKIGNPGVDEDEVLLTLLPFDGGLETVDNIENVAVAVDGEEPDALTIQGVDESQTDTDSISTESIDQLFTEYEADR